MNKPACINGITGVRLNCFGSIVSVEVEIDNFWVTVISEHYHGDGHLSHIVEPSGIVEAKRLQAT